MTVLFLSDLVTLAGHVVGEVACERFGLARKRRRSEVQVEDRGRMILSGCEIGQRLLSLLLIFLLRLAEEQGEGRKERLGKEGHGTSTKIAFLIHSTPSKPLAGAERLPLRVNRERMRMASATLDTLSNRLTRGNHFFVGISD